MILVKSMIYPNFCYCNLSTLPILWLDKELHSNPGNMHKLAVSVHFALLVKMAAMGK